MQASIDQIIAGYQQFRQQQDVKPDNTFKKLATGQSPKVMCIACADSRVDPAVLFQASPGEMFMLRNIANIVPPYEKDDYHHGTSSGLEFGVCYLNVEHLIILGHSSCGGIDAKLNPNALNQQNDFISTWLEQIPNPNADATVDECAKTNIINSYHNCLTFPWIKKRVDERSLQIHLWFFDIAKAEISCFDKLKDWFILK